ncbi:hypothetical protein GCM10010294_41750 [Streptomyces griseoloalbus]|nr:hypothetical protein GCM10010294_41750 [Streptomyces griseoloalbus]
MIAGTSVPPVPAVASSACPDSTVLVIVTVTAGAGGGTSGVALSSSVEPGGVAPGVASSLLGDAPGGRSVLVLLPGGVAGGDGDRGVWDDVWEGDVEPPDS